MESRLPDETPSEPNPSQVSLYELKLQGHLGNEWTEWFEGAVIVPQDNGDTILTCAVRDQAALHGLLKRVRDLGMTLLAVNCVSSQPDSAPVLLLPIKKEKNECQQNSD